MRQLRLFAAVIFFCLFLIHNLQAADSQIYFYSWGSHPALSDENIIPLENWQIAGSEDLWQNIPVPFFITGLERFKIQAAFTLSGREQKGRYVLICHGLKGAARIYLNNRLFRFKNNDGVPFRLEFDNDDLHEDGQNILRMDLEIPQSADRGFPDYVHLFSEASYLGITRPLFIRFEPNNRIEGFKASLQSIENQTARIAISYQAALDPQLPEDERDISVSERIESGQGEMLSRSGTKLSADSPFRSVQFSLPVSSLWTPENPRMLAAEITVRHNNQIIAAKTFKFGVKKFENNRGQFFLNDEAIIIRGVNYYENLYSFKDKDYYDLIQSDFSAIKSLGFNAIRFPHYIPDPAMICIADSLGLMLFAELPIYRYPEPLYLNDILLENSKNSIKNLAPFYYKSPSLTAIGIGQEIPIYKSSAQKFMLILKSFVSSNLPAPSYLSPVPGASHSLELSADFYVLDLYEPLQAYPGLGRIGRTAYLLAGKAGIVKNENINAWDSDLSNMKRVTFLQREIQVMLNDLKLQGGFIESYSDWLADTPTHLTVKDSNATLMPHGLFTEDRRLKHWAKNLSGLWDAESEPLVLDTAEGKRTNFFSILLFFASILFFAVYRQRPRLRENLRRAFRHSYGFFVDMRERRIIPLFNSFMVGGFAALIIGTYFSSFFYYYSDSYGMQELISLFLIPVGIFDEYLILSSHPATLTVVFFFVFFLYPVFVSIILKLISIFSGERIRFRQGLAIGLWSGVPLFFMLPISLIVYHLMHYPRLELYLSYILVFFIIWAHIRIINGIRVLFLTKVGKVFIIILLSYIVPFFIFWAVFRPEPHWYDYFKLLLSGRGFF